MKTFKLSIESVEYHCLSLNIAAIFYLIIILASGFVGKSACFNFARVAKMGNWFRSTTTSTPTPAMTATATSNAPDAHPSNTQLASTTNKKVDTSIMEISNKACFGAGCYWGTEKYFTVDFCRRMFPESLIRGKVGFMGPPGSPKYPTYEDVCTGYCIIRRILTSLRHCYPICICMYHG